MSYTRRQYVVPPRRMAEARDGSFAVSGTSGVLPHPITEYGWNPEGMGQQATQAENLTLLTASIAAAAGSIGQAVTAPSIAKEQRRLAEAQFRLYASQSAQRGASFRYAIKSVGWIGAAALALYVGRAMLERKRK